MLNSPLMNDRSSFVAHVPPRWRNAFRASSPPVLGRTNNNNNNKNVAEGEKRRIRMQRSETSYSQRAERQPSFSAALPIYILRRICRRIRAFLAHILRASGGCTNAPCQTFIRNESSRSCFPPSVFIFLFFFFLLIFPMLRAVCLCQKGKLHFSKLTLSTCGGFFASIVPVEPRQFELLVRTMLIVIQT